MATTRNKVMWQEGMLMRPHHFQQQQRYNDYLDNQRFRAMNDLSWGFTELTLNNELLAQGKIMIDSASGTLPDGTVFSIPDQDALPDPLHPQHFPDERSRNIYLALPVASDVRNEISDGRRIGRYRLNYADVRDLHSEEGDTRTLTLGQLTPRIMSGAEDMSAYITLPLCRISDRHADGSLTLDDDFIPSCQNIQVSKKLRVYLKEVQGAIGGRASDLANRIGSPAQSGIADVAEFMMLQLLNRNQTRFTHHARRSQLHPEDFYLDLAGLLGELMTFTEPSRLPCPLDVYDHHDLTKTFKTLLRRKKPARLSSRASWQQPESDDRRSHAAPRYGDAPFNHEQPDDAGASFCSGVWISHLLENLPEEKLASALKDDNPNWEYIDGEIVKQGSLAHSQLDIPELQRRGLVILASESKDFRLLAHLLRTLQHAGDPHLALRLLALYVEHYWAVAAPQNMAHKKRFASQVIKRFETGIEVFSQNAATAQRDALSGELAKLAQCWQSHNAPELAQATDDLFALYQRAFNRAAPAPVPTPAASGSSPQTTATSESGVTQPSAPAPQIVIDSHDDKAWRDTLLKVAAILCERQPDSPQGYRLRRHALWQNITSTPQAESDGRTPLAAVSADMVADYHAQLGSADMALWQQVEKSVLLAPYWLDGHCLSAQTALRLGYKQVADAIRDEVIRFLERLPQLTGLLFNDHTPFISEQTKQWLAASPDAKVAPVAQIGEESKAARACFAERGLEAALRYLDMLPEGDPRDQFHRQYLAAQLTEEAGLVQLAQQQYRMLFRMGLQMMVADWEPSLLEQLEQKFTAEQ